jgi:pyruvate ferredoxin oxidoreductase delta subunit
MNRPPLQKYIKPKHIKEYPTGPCYDAGNIVTENSGWRTERPVLENEKCSGCFSCYLFCPEGVIFKKGKIVDIDYSFCKGCGICAKICLKKAIKMVREGDGNGR